VTTAEDKRKINNGTDEFDPFIVFILHNTHTHTHNFMSYISSFYLARIYIYILLARSLLWVKLFFFKETQILILKQCQIRSILITLQLELYMDFNEFNNFIVFVNYFYLIL
jgi:hypothetical protein